MRKPLSPANKVLGITFAFTLAASSSMAYAQTSSRAVEQDPEAPDRGSEQQSGNFLEDKGLSFDVSYIVDWSRVASGGLERRNTARGLLDLTLELDLEELFDLRSGKFFAQYYAKRGRNGSDDVGDIQGISSIDGDDVNHFVELWYEQWLFDDAFRIKVGKVRADTEFAFIESAGDVLNASAGHSPTILHMPTYPHSALSFNAFLYPTRWAYFGVAAYDGPSSLCGPREPRGGLGSSYSWIAELGFTWQKLGSSRSGRFAIGPWYHHHSENVARFDGKSGSSTVGFYSVFEQQVWREAPGVEAEQGMSLFLQYGYADEAVSEFGHHASVGLVSDGALGGRDEDVFGLMLSFVKLSKLPEAHFDLNETTLELFYRLQIADFVALVPDVQYVIHPSGSSTVKNTLVGTIRFELTLGSENLWRASGQ